TMAGCGGVWVGDAGCICLVREKRFVTRSFPCLEQPHLMRLLIALIFFAASALAQSAPASEAVLEVFVREDCPHCAAAKEYLPTIARERSDLQVVVRTIDNDAQALEDLIRHSRMAGQWPPGVPAFVIQGRILVGFDT